MAQTLKLNTMKKKLQLNKEIISILDRNSMRQMTKAGAAPTERTCDHSDVCNSTLCMYDTILHEKCESRVCIETGRTGCETYNDGCQIATQHFTCAQKTIQPCLEETDNFCDTISELCAVKISVDVC